MELWGRPRALDDVCRSNANNAATAHSEPEETESYRGKVLVRTVLASLYGLSEAAQKERYAPLKRDTLLY